MDLETKAYFLKVYDEYSEAIYRFCAIKTSDPELSHDMAQEVFMRFWDTMQNKTHIEFPRALLYTIARNVVIDWYRKHKSVSLDELEEGGYEPSDTSHTEIERDAEHARVLAVLHQLSPKNREIIALRFVEGLPPREIAEIMNENTNVISVRINHALKELRALLDPQIDPK